MVRACLTLPHDRTVIDRPFQAAATSSGQPYLLQPSMYSAFIKAFIAFSVEGPGVAAARRDGGGVLSH